MLCRMIYLGHSKYRYISYRIPRCLVAPGIGSMPLRRVHTVNRLMTNRSGAPL